jgi:alanyl-tRNA synthetase
MTHKEIRDSFIQFFKEKGHAPQPSSSLVPEGDSSVLFTTAGMQQFKPFYTGTPSPAGDKLCSVQKCLRTSDIEEVGDETHLTFFEMLGNFAFNSAVSKKEAITCAYEYMTDVLGLTIDYVTIFGGDDLTPRDDESEAIWREVDANLDIREEGREDVFWGPTGNEGPCGPTTEIYVNGVEIWNIVFNEYYCDADKNYTELKDKGIDTGMGLERLLVQVQGKDNVFETDLMWSLIQEIEKQSGKKYYFKAGDLGLEQKPECWDKDVKSMRVAADHIRSSSFLINDGVRPSNTEQGYILRRLLRGAIMHAKKLGMDTLTGLVSVVVSEYEGQYVFDTDMIVSVIRDEEEKFSKTLENGLKEFEKGERDAFVLFTTYGFPLEMTIELAKEIGEDINIEEFDKKMQEHQEKSKAGSEKKFKGGLAGHSDMEIQYHTATHLLHQALRDVLGNHVQQKGSNITPDRLRFDFAHGEKMTPEEKERVEMLVNEKIQESLPVTCEEMSLDEARKLGAIGLFGDKYGDTVTVYRVGTPDATYSLEFCGGPHVENTSELGHFRIKKEEASSAGVRRIKAVLE